MIAKVRIASSIVTGYNDITPRTKASVGYGSRRLGVSIEESYREARASAASTIDAAERPASLTERSRTQASLSYKQIKVASAAQWQKLQESAPENPFSRPNTHSRVASRRHIYDAGAPRYLAFLRRGQATSCLQITLLPFTPLSFIDSRRHQRITTLRFTLSDPRRSASRHCREI